MLMPQIFLIILNIYCVCGLLYPALPQEDTLFKREYKNSSCDEEVLLNHLAEIRVINPESIFNIAATEDWSAMCRKVLDSMEKTDKYLASCSSLQEPNLFLQLIKGVKSLYEKLCVSKFKDKFEIYYKCIKEIAPAFEDCIGPSDWIENTSKDKVCMVYKDIVDCYYVKIATVCGKKAASNFKELMLVVINSILTISCSEVNEDPDVEDAMPESYIADALGTTVAIASTISKPSNFLHFLGTTIILILYITFRL